MNVKAADQEYIANTYSRFDLQIVSGHGSLVYDDAGKEYIDLGSGTAANAVGVCDAYWQQAVIERGKYHAVAYKSSVAYFDAALVLKVAAAVDEHIAAQLDVLAAVGVKRREKAEALFHGAAGKLRE